MISVNKNAENILLEIMNKLDILNIEYKELSNGGKIFNFTNANLDGGIYLGKICAGGLSEIKLMPVTERIKAKSGEIELEVIEVMTNEPIISCMASQYAGWNVKVKYINEKGEKKTKFKCMGSGPARALARTEKELFEKIKYEDNHDATVLVLETSKEPDEDVVDYVAKKCKVKPEKVYLAYAPTACLAGSVQIAARIVETSIHKFLEIGMPPEWIKEGNGTCPIAPIAKDDFTAMGWTNDCIMFMGNVNLKMDVPASEENKLKELVEKCPSSSSSSYGKPFAQVFKEAGGDFYKIDPGMFAPAKISVLNRETGNYFEAGKLNPEVLDFSE
ncbi:MAG: methenyltetrahydromethanopterin cyclohydrolase [Promethearchaeota archaeon]